VDLEPVATITPCNRELTATGIHFLSLQINARRRAEAQPRNAQFHNFNLRLGLATIGHGQYRNMNSFRAAPSL
jgi:hypothetical protein